MKKFLLFIFLLISTDVLSFEKTTNFTFEKFERAKKEGKTIVINSWNKNCTTCKKQSKILSNAINDFKNVEFLFYEQTKYKKIASALNIKFWATIVIFKGQNEISREIGLIKKEDIYKLIKKGI